MSTPDEAVRDYLKHRADPTSVAADTGDLDARIDAETDPVERLKLRSERSRLQDVGPTLEAAFVAHAASWASDHGVEAEAFLEEGVDRRVLVEAGLLSGTPRRRSGAPRSSAATRAPRVTSEAIADHVRGLRKGTELTTATVSNDAGGSPATVRKVLDQLVADGTITEDGKDHSGPGRPRTLYRRA